MWATPFCRQWMLSTVFSSHAAECTVVKSLYHQQSPKWTSALEFSISSHCTSNSHETPQNGWLPYLKKKIRLFNGFVNLKWYREEGSKNILITAKSAHLIASKRTFIRNMRKGKQNVHWRSWAGQVVKVGFPNSKQQWLPPYVPLVSNEVSAVVQRRIFRVQL